MMADRSEELKRLARSVMAHKPPVILTRADAMDAAATFLERNASSLGLASSLLKMIGPDGGGEHADVIAEIRKQAVEPALQMAAMRAAAGSIREMALEERLVAARAAQQQDRTR